MWFSVKKLRSRDSFAETIDWETYKISLEFVRQFFLKDHLPALLLVVIYHSLMNNNVLGDFKLIYYCTLQDQNNSVMLLPF